MEIIFETFPDSKVTMGVLSGLLAFSRAIKSLLRDLFRSPVEVTL